MGYQILFVCACLVHCAIAGYNDGPTGYEEPQGIATQQGNVLRSPGNLGQLAAYSKAQRAPYPNVQRADTRGSNDALAYTAPAPAPVRDQAYATAPEPAYAPNPAPARAQAYAPAPARAQAYAPAPARAQAYAPAPARAQAYAPAPSYPSAPEQPYPAPAAPIPPRQNLLGIAYSSAPEVARITYKNGYGTTYTY